MIWKGRIKKKIGISYQDWKGRWEERLLTDFRFLRFVFCKIPENFPEKNLLICPFPPQWIEGVTRICNSSRFRITNDRL